MVQPTPPGGGLPAPPVAPVAPVVPPVVASPASLASPTLTRAAPPTPTKSFIDPTTYTQILHVVAMVGLVVWVTINKLSVDQGLTYLALLLGIALPSPFKQ